MDLFKTVNRDMTRQILEAKGSSLKEKVAEHNELAKQMAVLGKITKAIGSRITVLTVEMTPIVKEMDKQMKVVDNAILKYKEKKGTSVKYKEGVEKALEIVNEKQQAVLNEFMKSVTTRTTKDTLEIADPDVANFVKNLKDIEPEDLMAKIGELSKFPKQIAAKKKREATKKESLELSEEDTLLDKAKKAVKKLVNVFKMLFSKVEKKAEESSDAVDDLVRAVGDGTVNTVAESNLTEDPDVLHKHLDVTLRKKFDLTDEQVTNMSNAIEAGAGDYGEYIATAHNDSNDKDKMSTDTVAKLTRDLEEFILSKLG